MTEARTDPCSVGLAWLDEPRAVLGEGPVWNPQTKRLLWVDCDQKKLFDLDPQSGAVSTRQLPSAPGSYAFRNGGGMIMAYRNKLVLLDKAGEVERVVETPLLDFSVERFNDGACDCLGRFWVGSMDPKMARPTGSLFCVEPDLKIRKVQTEITVSNGIAFGPDNRTLYHTDSRIGTIYAYDFDLEAGAISNRRTHIDFKYVGGRPDGCTIDSDGHLWVAVIETGAIVRFDPAGREASRIGLPITRPTSTMFGGEDLRTLYITSMRHALSPAELAEQPLAGCLLSVRTEQHGMPEPFFAG
jgi:sugar lactone lactonase YvrE